MAQFVNAPGFASFHPSPIQIEFDGLGEMINFPTADGNSAQGYLIKTNANTAQWLFVYKNGGGSMIRSSNRQRSFMKTLGKSEYNRLGYVGWKSNFYPSGSRSIHAIRERGNNIIDL